MKRPLTLAEMRAEGRDPLSLLSTDRAVLVDPAWLARVGAGAPLMFWDDDEEERPAEPYAASGGVAVVDVEGPIAQRGWMCADGYDTVCGNLEAALADPAVRTVLLRINSPGGAAAGAFEWTGRMRELVVASRKRCVAYADEMACSGAYAVACVADEIVTPETGVVGSVGVIASMVSWAKANEAEGIDFRAITSGAEKADGCPNLPLDEAAIARAQREVDTIAGVFHRWVATRRGMTPEAVRALEAGVRMGAEAVATRLADRVLGYHALLAELTAAASAAPSRGPLSPNAGARRAATRHPMTTRSSASPSAPRMDAGPTHDVGSRVRVAIDPPHMAGQATGEVREAVLTYAYGIVFDGMEAEGVHHWYVESELAAEGAGEGAAGEMPMDASRANTPAARRGAPRRILSEQTLAALSAATGESDPDKAVSALLTRVKDAGASVEKLSTDLAARDTTIERLSTDLAASREADLAAQTRIEGIERAAEIAAAKAEGKWSPSLESFLGTLSVAQLRTWRASAPRVVPEGEIKAPAEEPRSDAQMPAEIGAIVAKAHADGWKSLSAGERHAVQSFDKTLAARLRGGR